MVESVTCPSCGSLVPSPKPDAEVKTVMAGVTIDTVADKLLRPKDSARHEAMRQAAVGNRGRDAEIARKVLASGPDVNAEHAALVAIRDGTEPVWPADRKDLRD